MSQRFGFSGLHQVQELITLESQPVFKWHRHCSFNRINTSGKCGVVCRLRLYAITHGAQYRFGISFGDFLITNFR